MLLKLVFVESWKLRVKGMDPFLKNKTKKKVVFKNTVLPVLLCGE